MNNNYPTIKNTIWVSLCFIALQLLTGVIMSILITILEFAGLYISENIHNILYILSQILVYFLIIYYLMEKDFIKIESFLFLDRINTYVVFCFIILFAGSAIVFSEFNNIFYHFFPMPQFLLDVFNQVFYLDSIVISIILIVLIPAVFEEVLFRGFILFGLNKIYSQRKSILISSLLFGLVHLNPWQFITAFLLGMIFSWIALKTKSIILPIAGHFLNNLMALLAVRYLNMEMQSSNGFEMQPLVQDLMGVLAMIIGFYLLYQHFNIKEENSE